MAPVSPGRRAARSGRPCPRRSALAALAAVVLLAGCGGDDRLSKSAYEERVRSEYAEVQAAFRATRGVDGVKLAARIGAAQGQLREAAGALDEVTPPKEVEGEHDQLVEGMRRYAERLDRLRNAAARGDQQVLDEAAAQIGRNEAVKQMAEAAERMKFKGYDLGPIAEE